MVSGVIRTTGLKLEKVTSNKSYSHKFLQTTKLYLFCSLQVRIVLDVIIKLREPLCGLQLYHASGRCGGIKY